MKMLGRKQSLKGEPVLADYGPEESLNESADIEWVNKVISPILDVILKLSMVAPSSIYLYKSKYVDVNSS